MNQRNNCYKDIRTKTKLTKSMRKHIFNDQKTEKQKLPLVICPYINNKFMFTKHTSINSSQEFN